MLTFFYIDEDISARPLAALKDPKSFPAPPVHRVAHGMQAAPAPAPAAPMYDQPPAPAYGQPPVPSYGQPPVQYPPASTPPYSAPSGQFQPPAPMATGQYQPPVVAPVNQFHPPAAMPSPSVPASQYPIPPASQYQPPPITYSHPATHQTPTPPGQLPEQAQPPVFNPPVPNNYVPPGSGPQGTYQPPTANHTTPPPPLPPASGRPLPPPRSSTQTVFTPSSGVPVNTGPPEAPPRAPLPDPSSFPKPPPLYGYQSADQVAPAPPSRAKSVSAPMSTYTPPAPPSLPGLPPRSVPAIPAVPSVPVVPSFSSIPAIPPVPAVPAVPTAVSVHSPVPVPVAGRSSVPVPAVSPVPILPTRTPPVPGPKPHKKAPPPPVKPKKFGTLHAPTPEAERPNSPPPPYINEYATEAAASHQQQQAGVSAIAAQLNQINIGKTDSGNDGIEKSSTSGSSIRDKIKALNSTQPNFANQIAGHFNHSEFPAPHQEDQQHSSMQPKSSSFKKPAPPPPAKKKFAVPLNASHSPVPSPAPISEVAVGPSALETAPASKNTPPPINFSTRPQGYEIPATSSVAPAAPAKPASEPPKPGQKEFDLQLETLWFAQPTIMLPPTLSGLNYTYSIVTSGTGNSLTLALRISEDLSIVKYRISWPSGISGPALAAAVQQERKEMPPPPTLTQVQLIQAHEQFGNGVATFGESVLGQQVGDGECWTLAKEAIDQSSHGYAMSPAGYTHGALVYHAMGGAAAPLAYNDSIRRGDILQFTSGKFETRDAVTGMVRATSHVGAPNHTSIVTSVSANNRIVDIVHQNVGGSRKVQTGQHNLDEFVAGEIKIFRPVWKEWAGELTTTFEN